MSLSEFESSNASLQSDRPTLEKIPATRRSRSLSGNILRGLGTAGAGITASYAGLSSAAPVTIPINQNLSFSASLVSESHAFDVDNNGQDDVVFSSDFHGGSMSIGMSGASGASFFQDTTSFDEQSELSSPSGIPTTEAASVFEFGELISASPQSGSVLLAAFNLDFSNGTGDGHFFNTAGPRIAGFSFLIDGQYHAGQLRASVALAPNDTAILSLVDFTYESEPGVDLVAVPEPDAGVLAVLASGAAGLAKRRRRSCAD